MKKIRLRVTKSKDDIPTIYSNISGKHYFPSTISQNDSNEVFMDYTFHHRGKWHKGTSCMKNQKLLNSIIEYAIENGILEPNKDISEICEIDHLRQAA